MPRQTKGNLYERADQGLLEHVEGTRIEMESGV